MAKKEAAADLEAGASPKLLYDQVIAPPPTTTALIPPTL
jgi:hypothetical protein